MTSGPISEDTPPISPERVPTATPQRRSPPASMSSRGFQAISATASSSAQATNMFSVRTGRPSVRRTVSAVISIIGTSSQAKRRSA